VALAGMLVLLRLVWVPFRTPSARSKVIRRIGFLVVTAMWAIGIAATAAIDLAVYVGQWVDWSHFRVGEFHEPFTYPSKEVRAGVCTAVAVAVTLIALAVFLLMWGRRDRGVGTHATNES